MCQNNGRTRYNCTIIDLYDRSVIASVNAEHINTELAIAKLREALNAEKNTKGLVLHSEQGVQYVRHHSYNKYSTPMEARFS
jgi:putative transposase